MKKTKLVTFIIIFAVILIGAIFFYLGQHREPTNQINVNNNPQENINTTEEKLPEILGNKDDLVSFSVVSGSTISGKMAVSGIVKNAYFFEGNILLNVLDQNKNVLKTGHGSAITDWMTSGPVSFQGIIDTLGLPTGAAYIEIRNDNPSGMPENNKSILIPVVIQ